MTEYVELHARSAFHFLQGASRPRPLVEAMSQAGIRTAACPDRNGLYGAPEFEFAAADYGMDAIIGTEVSLARELSHDWTEGECLGHLPVLVADQAGYQNLCRLLTRMHLRWHKSAARARPGQSQTPLATLEELAAHAQGLHALTGDREGPLGQAWRSGGARAMRAALESLIGVFSKDRLSVEIQRHLDRGERAYNRALVDLAQHYDLPLVATQAPAYVDPVGRRVLDIFSCLRAHTTIERAGRLLERNTERYVKTPAQMRTLFADLPAALENGVRLAARLPFRLRDLGYRFPQFPVPEGHSMDSFLAKLTRFGAKNRYGTLTQKVRRQLDHELAVIAKLGFAGYFLIVWDIVNFCTERGILAQGRGSAANSAVCYSLGITAVDPIASGLLFERFLSEGRRGWPDIDIDLPSGELREQVIQEVYQRYGRHGAAMTANVITYRGRSAMREIGKVLGLPVDLVERFNALFARGDFPHTLSLDKQLREAGIDRTNPRHTAALEVYRATTGLPRNLGQHSGGMVICNDALNSVVPLENASMPGRVVLQWDKDACEDLGMVKIDLLGLGMMAVMQDCLELTHQEDRGVDLAKIPKDDAATYDMLGRAETIGVFQVESRAQMATLPRMKPRCFYDMAIEVAIIRPGPIAGNLTNPYLDRRNGLAPVEYIDERLKPVLERTLGVPMFQEQVLHMGIIMAGFDANESEKLRRALGFSRNETRINEAKDALRQRLAEREVPPEKAEWLVNTIDSFSLYGFPESHAISFALIAYASAWLKVHRPQEFFCALLNNQPMGFYGPATLIQDAKRCGLRFLPPDILHSDWDCTLESRAGRRCIRLGLRMVKGLSRRAAEGLTAARCERGFGSIDDLRRRCDLSIDALRTLARSGALNPLARSRRQALWQIERPLELDLFAAAEEPAPYGCAARSDESIPLEEMTLWERICADFETTHVTTGEHPMRHLRREIGAPLSSATDLEQLRDGARTRVAGAVICRQRPGTAKGVVFISLEDETGICNCVLWPNFFEKMRLLVVQEPYLLISGKVQKSQGTIHLIANKVERLQIDGAPASASHDFH